MRRLTHALPDGRTVSALAYGDAPPVVTFLHGAGLNAHTWDTTVLALGLPALAVDLPGLAPAEGVGGSKRAAEKVAASVMIEREGVGGGNDG